MCLIASNINAFERLEKKDLEQEIKVLLSIIKGPWLLMAMRKYLSTGIKEDKTFESRVDLLFSETSGLGMRNGIEEFRP